MDSILPRGQSKNQKILKGADVSSCSNVPDRISTLPDAVLGQILSFLPTRFAAQTGVLSKRWKKLWISVPTLDFDIKLQDRGNMAKFDGFAKSDDIQSFTNFVDRLLFVRDHSSIREFRFSFDDRFDPRRFYAWMWIVIMSNIEVLDLDMRSLVGIRELPWSLFSSKSLVVLKLSGRFLLAIPCTASFPRLRTLCLKYVMYVSDASIEELLSACPVLEDLQITRERWDNAVNIVIAQPSLKRLTFESYGDTSMQSSNRAGGRIKYKLLVKAPNVEYMKLVDFASDDMAVEHMPCVNEANINVNNLGEEVGWTNIQRRNYGKKICGILGSLCKVKHLSLGGETLKALRAASESRVLLFHNLVHLVLGFDYLHGPILLPGFLGLCPNLESLVFPDGMTCTCLDVGVENRGHVPYFWEPPEVVPGCLLHTLKSIEIESFCGEEPEELKLVKFLLENAMVLKEMTLVCHADCVDMYSFRDELMAYKRGSAACQVCILPEAGDE
ncbi:FBD-associated F-box protein At4g10400 isoform X1 [Coffea arabica]|uniref:FBD-associated F-box protein At4g10400 isoform X1 n=1 Tax=Coffea arabica TaxID=13443 RepID=A0A6P6TPT7_COFAR|nr:FBD-associated F-box protein At4g10400-like isoform X1 [Coffea arabica]